MALTPKITPQNQEVSGKGRGWHAFGRFKVAIGNLTFNAGDVYTTGGFSIVQGGSVGPAQTFVNYVEQALGIHQIEDIIFMGSGSTGTGNLSGELFGIYSYGNKMVQLHQIGRGTDNSKAAPNTQVTNGALLTGVNLPIIVIGT